jgi:capsular exopolysaccharide synthesis family protein
VEGATPLALIKTLRHHWLLASIVGFATGSLLGGAVWLFKPEKYEAYALLRVAATEQHLLETPNNQQIELDRNSAYQKTQMALITSRPVIKAALSKDKINQLPLVRKHGTLADQVAWLEKELQARYIENTEILRLSLMATEPDDLPVIVNAVQQAYVDEIVDAERKRQVDWLHDLDEIYASSQKNLRQQREFLRRLADTLKTSDSQVVSIKQKNLLDEYLTFRKELATTQARLRDAQVKLAVQKARLQSEAGKVGAAPSGVRSVLEATIDKEVDADLIVQRQLAEVIKAQEAVTQDETTTQPGFPSRERHERALRQAKASLDRIRAERRQAVATRVRGLVEGETLESARQTEEEIKMLQQHQDVIRKDADLLREDAERIGTSSVDLELKRSEIEQAENTIKALKQERDRLQMELQSTSKRRVRLLERADDATVPNKKKHLLETAAAFLGGAFLGVFGISYRAFRTRTIYHAEEVETGLGLRVVGTIPAFSGASNGALLGTGTHSNGNPPDYLLAESVDYVRTMLMHARANHTGFLLVVTSARSREGKTTLASNLAMSIARAGHKTLLIDCDLRRPNLHKLFDLKRAPGVSELLTGTAKLDEAIQPTSAAMQPMSLEHLSFLPAGQYTAGAGAALARGEIAKLFNELRPQFEFLVVDTSPVLAVADALLIARCADTTILSVRPGLSAMPYVYAATERLKALGVRILGTVVNGVSDKTLYDDYAYLSQESE